MERICGASKWGNKNSRGTAKPFLVPYKYYEEIKEYFKRSIFLITI